MTDQQRQSLVARLKQFAEFAASYGAAHGFASAFVIDQMAQGALDDVVQYLAQDDLK